MDYNKEIELLRGRIDSLENEIKLLKEFNAVLLEKLDEIWKSITNLGLDNASNKMDIRLLFDKIIKDGEDI